MLRRIAVVFSKEVLDNLRDRRSLGLALLMPLLGPAVAVLLLVVLGELQSEYVDQPLLLPVAGAHYAPKLVEFLQEQDVTVLPPPADAEAAVKAGDHDVVLVIPESYPERFRAGEPAPVRLVMDASRQSAARSIRRASTLLRAYGGQVGSLRLLARGVNPSIRYAVVVERVDVATAESRGAMVLSMIPYFIVLAVFLGGLYVAIDTTAGELERGSLEPLFINPIRRWELLLGKLMATWVFSIVSLLVTIIGFGVVPRLVETENIGFQIRLDPMVLANVFVLFLPLTLFASAIQMVVATFSRSFKEAQTQISVLVIIPVIPGVILTLLPFKTQIWMMLIPTLSEQLLTNKLLRGDPIDGLSTLLSVSATLLLAAGAFLVAVKLYEGERLLRRR